MPRRVVDIPVPLEDGVAADRPDTVRRSSIAIVGT